MPATILVVKPDNNLFQQLKQKLRPHQEEFTVHSSDSRIDALEKMEEIDFDLVVSCLEIPRISDGYRFLSTIVGKKIAADKIIVVKKQKGNAADPNITFLGIKNLCTIDDIDGILGIILQDRSVSPSAEKKVEMAIPLPLGKSATDIESLRHALNNVMGPVGPMIFNNAQHSCKNSSDPEELKEKIIAEIDNEEQIRELLNTL